MIWWVGILALLIIAPGLALVLDLPALLSFDTLKQHRVTLTSFVAAHRVAAASLYVLLYIAVVIASLPGALILTVTGGFLFGAGLGGSLAVLAATFGGSMIFLIARSTIGEGLRSKAGHRMARIAEGFDHNAFSYVLVLRLVPLFPFVLVNLACALLGIRLSTFVAGTALGILPGSFIYATVGAGLGSVFDRGETLSPASVLTPQVVVGLVGLAVLALLPAAYRRWKRTSTSH